MCNPLAVAAVAIEGASQVASHVGQNKAAKANRKASLQDLAIQYSDLNARAIEEQAAASRASGDASAQAGSLRSDVVVGAASGNVSGNSVTAVLQDLARQEANAKDTIAVNLENTLSQVQRSKRGAHADAVSRINGVSRASIIGTGLKIGGAVVGGLAHNQELKNQ